MNIFKLTSIAFIFFILSAQLSAAQSPGGKRLGIFVGVSDHIEQVAQDWVSGQEAPLDDAVHLSADDVKSIQAAIASDYKNSNAVDLEMAASELINGEVLDMLRSYVPYLPETEIIIVGHSAGGFAARAMGGVLNNLSDIDLSGIGIPTQELNIDVSTTVITVATPHQGIRAADDLVGVANRMDQWAEEAAPSVEAAGVQAGTWILDKLSGTDNREGINQLKDAFVVMPVLASFFTNDGTETIGSINYANDGSSDVYSEVNEAAEDLIAPGGVVPSLLNAMPDPDRHLTISGHEKHYVLPRVLSEITDVLSGEIGNEKKARSKWKDIISWYAANRDVWRAGCLPINGDHYGYPNACKHHAEWSSARDEWENVDVAHAEAIDSYTIESYRYRKMKKIYCQSYEGDPNKSDPVYSYMDVSKDVDGCGGDAGYVWSYEWVTGYSTIEKENDGIIIAQDATWNGVVPSETVNALSGENGDAVFPSQGAGMGFNHFELIRAERAYSDLNEGFDVGDDNPPMEEARRWVNR